MSKVNKWMRSKQTTFLVGICCLLMVVWIIGPSLSNLFIRSNVKDGIIFDHRVPGRAVITLASILPLISPQETSVRDEQQWIGLAWHTKILAEESQRYGVEVTDEDVQQFLDRNFSARGGTGFDETAYSEFLQRRSLSRTDYEQAVRASLAGQKVIMAVANMATVNPQEAWNWYARQGEQAQVRYVRLPGDELRWLTHPAEDEVKEFYDKHAEQAADATPDGVGYQNPEKVKIEYILAAYEPFLKDAKVTADDIKAYYEKNKEAKYRLTAEELKAQTEKKADAPAADPLKPEAKPEEPKPVYKPLADVSDAIVADLRREFAEKKAADLMKTVSAEVTLASDVPFGSQEIRKVSLSDIGKKHGLKCEITPFFTAKEATKALPGATDLATKAFGRKTTGLYVPSNTLKATEGIYLFQVLESQPAKAAPYLEVKATVVDDLKREKGLELARELATKAQKEKNLAAAIAALRVQLAELVKNADKDTPLGDKSVERFYKVDESKFFQKPAEMYGTKVSFGTGIEGNPVAFTEAAFALKEGELGMAVEPAAVPPSAFVMQRTGTKGADRAYFDKNVSAMSNYVLAEKRQAIVGSWFADVRRRARPSEDVMKYLNLLPQWSTPAN